MKSFIFVFLGVTETGTNANIKTLQAKLEESLAKHIQPIKFTLKDELLILTLKNPDFRFYLSFEKNVNESLPEWIDLAKNFELPWDRKPVNKERLQNIYNLLEDEGWSEYKPFYEIGFTILSEMEKFSKLKVFTIPSMKKSSWRRIFKLRG
jgi:hypothetical protein